MTVPANRRRVRQWWSEFAAKVPEGVTVLEAAVSMECIDSEGKVCLMNLTSDSLTDWKAWGMFESAADDMKMRLRCGNYVEEDTDE